MLVGRIVSWLNNRIFRFFHLPNRRVKNHSVQLSVPSDDPIQQVSDEYLSFSIDISVVVGGYWWEGSQGVKRGLGTLRVPPINLTNKKLDRLVQALGPSYLRVGGSEADKIYYFNAPPDAVNPIVLTQTIWHQLNEFVLRNQLKLVFTFKYGLFNRNQHGAWQGSEIQKLLAYNQQHQWPISVAELGNELNAYWAFHGLQSQPNGKKLAQDFATFASFIKHYFPDIKIMGPGSAYWPKLGESLATTNTLTKKFLSNLNFKIDIVSWHYYPFQSTRSPIRTRTATLRAMLSPNSYKDFVHYSARLLQWRDLYQPQASFWTGETGSAQCGGQPNLSDRFISCFWWAEQLGCGAVLGQQVMIRQSLIGGDYALINRLTLKPRPDYWLSWLWVNLMGKKVYAIKSNHPRVKVYCHQTAHNPELKTIMLINFSNYKARVDMQNMPPIKQVFVLTAASIDSKKVFINGRKPKFNKGKVSLTDFTHPTFKPDATANLKPELEPFSIHFWVMDKPDSLE